MYRNIEWIRGEKNGLRCTPCIFKIQTRHIAVTNIPYKNSFIYLHSNHVKREAKNDVTLAVEFNMLMIAMCQ
jgi:hypothetical protein